ncbi:MAG: alpha/beta hydrolase [Aquificae bacterium]|nr:alpha/beta hydrolase [Aquificota bacterium]
MEKIKSLSVETEDGFVLKGFLHYPSIDMERFPAVIFVHQFATTHIIWEGFAKKVRELGFATLLFDLRGHGISTLQNGKENRIIFNPKFSSLVDLIGFFKKSASKVNFKKIPEDIALWASYLLEKEKIRYPIVYVGSSLGGISVIGAVSLFKADGVVSISPGPPVIVGEAVVEDALRKNVDFLFVSSVEDPLGSGKLVFELVGKTSGGVSIITSGNGHGVTLLKYTERYILDFLKKFSLKV